MTAPTTPQPCTSLTLSETVGIGGLTRPAGSSRLDAHRSPKIGCGTSTNSAPLRRTRTEQASGSSSPADSASHATGLAAVRGRDHQPDRRRLSGIAGSPARYTGRRPHRNVWIHAGRYGYTPFKVVLGTDPSPFTCYGHPDDRSDIRHVIRPGQLPRMPDTPATTPSRSLMGGEGYLINQFLCRTPTTAPTNGRLHREPATIPGRDHQRNPPTRCPRDFPVICASPSPTSSQRQTLGRDRPNGPK